MNGQRKTVRCPSGGDIDKQRKTGLTFASLLELEIRCAEVANVFDESCVWPTKLILLVGNSTRLELREDIHVLRGFPFRVNNCWICQLLFAKQNLTSCFTLLVEETLFPLLNKENAVSSSAIPRLELCRVSCSAGIVRFRRSSDLVAWAGLLGASLLLLSWS